MIQDHYGSPAITSADQNKAVRIHKGVLEIDSVDTPIQCHAGGGNPSICDEGWSGGAQTNAHILAQNKLSLPFAQAFDYGAGSLHVGVICRPWYC